MRIDVSPALVALGLGALALPVTSAVGEPLVIRHEPVRCVLAERYPRIDACFEPSARVARARVYFREETATRWHFVEMQPVGTCHRGVLPRPLASTVGIRYYVAATDVLSAESRGEEYAAEVVTQERACRKGPLGPLLSSARVSVGGDGAPEGFASAAGGLGRRGLAAIVVGGAAVTGGAMLLGSGGGGTAATGGESASSGPTTAATTRPATTTTRPSPPTTRPSPTTTRPAPTTTTTTPSGCGSDSAPPQVQITSPANDASVGAQVQILVRATDPGPVSNGIRDVRLTAHEQAGRSVSIATLSGAGPIFGTTWTLPSCQGSKDTWTINAQATDGCSRSSTAQVRVQHKCGSAVAMTAISPRALVWTSELSGGGRAQVIANGTDLAFPSAGRSELALPLRPGVNRVEALLVSGTGVPGLWRFSARSEALVPGSLRAVAGDVVTIAAAAVTFRVRGGSGERVVFEFDAVLPAARGSVEEP